MAHNDICKLFGAWRAHETALTYDFSHQVNTVRFKRGLNVRQQNKLIQTNKANRKALLGKQHSPDFIYPRGKAWIRVAELSGL